MTTAELLHTLTLTNHVRLTPGDNDQLVRAAGMELIGSTWLPGITTLQWIIRQRGFARPIKPARAA